MIKAKLNVCLPANSTCTHVASTPQHPFLCTPLPLTRPAFLLSFALTRSCKKICDKSYQNYYFYNFQVPGKHIPFAFFECKNVQKWPNGMGMARVIPVCLEWHEDVRACLGAASPPTCAGAEKGRSVPIRGSLSRASERRSSPRSRCRVVSG
jgi:hypothetical protein